MLLRKLFFLLMAAVPLFSLAQQAAPDEKLPDDLQSLLNTPVAVASIKEMAVSESPAILTVLTREDFSRFGLRYLSDISFVVPGIAFGCDVLGVVGHGVRNNWAHEGKSLIMLDGIELHEELYSNTQFGNHYSLDNIEKIEIIRGPGSVIYGGNAALMVINMISKNSTNGQTINLNSGLSFTGKHLAERGGSVSVSQGNQRSGFSLFGRFARDIRSDRSYTDLAGNSFNMAESSEIENAAFYITGRHQDWSLQLLHDDYKLQSKDGYLTINENIGHTRFQSTDMRLKKIFRPTGYLEIIPSLNYKYQVPWSVIYQNNLENLDEIIRLHKATLGTHLTWSINDYHSLATGIEYWTETASTPEGTLPYFVDYNNRFHRSNFATFVQTTSRLRHWSFSPGARINYSYRYNVSFVPRFAVTRIWNWGYSKAIASRSYRNPSIMNMRANEFIKPEYATVLEIETGISFKAFSMLSVNVYHMMISDPITYYYDELTFEDKYINEGKAGTEGVELCFNHHFPYSKLILTASVSRPVSSNRHRLYKVEGHKNYLLGFSPYQFSVNYSYQLSRQTSLWTMFAFNGRRFGITSVDEFNNPVYTAYKETCLVNTGIRRPLDKAGRFSITAYINNLLNQPVNYIQPYKSYHGALPGKGREFGLAVNYQIK